MNIVFFLLPFALLMGFAFVALFVHAARSGQYDDLETPAHRILIDEKIESKKIAATAQALDPKGSSR